MAVNTKISQVNSATGVMGPTGSGKSFLLATLAAWVWQKHGKITRLYNSDGGGYPAAVQKLMALGIMEVFRMRTRDPGDLGLAFETAQRCAQGWWPRRIMPSSGEVPPGVEMVPPISVRFHGFCPNGHLTHDVFTEAQVAAAKVCPQCKTQVTKGNVRVQKVVAPTPGFEKVGAVCFDGLTATLAWEKLEMGHRAGRLELKGEESAIGGKVVSGDLKFGGTTRSHVGFVQDRGEELIHLSMGIPNLVVPPVWTMLTHEDVDDRGQSIRGPKISGRAKTDEAGQWFGNMLEAGMEEAENNAGLQRTLYLSQFYDAQNVKHLIKHRADPGTMPAKLQDPPDTDGVNSALAGSQFNLGVFFDLLDVALQSSVQKGLEEFPNAPGVAEGWVEYGSGYTAPANTPTAVAVAPVPQNVVEGKPQATGAPSAPVAPVKGPARGGKKQAANQPPAAVPVAQQAQPAAAQDATGAPTVPAAEIPAERTAADAGDNAAGAAGSDTAAAPVAAEPVQEPAPQAPAAVADTPAAAPTPPAAVPPAPAPAAPKAPAPVAPRPPQPAGARPAAVAAPSGARPAVAAPAGVRPGAPPVPRPAGMPPATVTGPGVPHPGAQPAHAPAAAAAVPRPPAAAPRPPAPTPSAPRPVGPGTKE